MDAHGRDNLSWRDACRPVLGVFLTTLALGLLAPNVVAQEAPVGRVEVKSVDYSTNANRVVERIRSKVSFPSSAANQPQYHEVTRTIDKGAAARRVSSGAAAAGRISRSYTGLGALASAATLAVSTADRFSYKDDQGVQMEKIDSETFGPAVYELDEGPFVEGSIEASFIGGYYGLQGYTNGGDSGLYGSPQAAAEAYFSSNNYHADPDKVLVDQEFIFNDPTYHFSRDWELADGVPGFWSHSVSVSVEPEYEHIPDITEPPATDSLYTELDDPDFGSVEMVEWTPEEETKLAEDLQGTEVTAADLAGMLEGMYGTGEVTDPDQSEELKQYVDEVMPTTYGISAQSDVAYEGGIPTSGGMTALDQAIQADAPSEVQDSVSTDWEQDLPPDYTTEQGFGTDSVSTGGSTGFDTDYGQGGQFDIEQEYYEESVFGEDEAADPATETQPELDIELDQPGVFPESSPEWQTEEITQSDLQTQDVGIGSTGQCIEPVQFSLPSAIGGETIELDFQPVCDFASMVRPVVIGTASVIALAVITGG